MRFRDWLMALSALAAVAVSIFAVGGALRWSQAVVAILVAVAVATTIVSQRGLGRLSPLVVLLGGAALLTFIQLVPLPQSLVELISPTMATLRADGAELAQVSPWNALTADAGGTLAALVFVLTLLGLAIVCLRMCASERGRYRILAAVAALCTLAALVTGLHKLVDAKLLYGVYKPVYANGALGPLLNANSLGCLFAMGTVLAISLAAHRRQAVWLRALWLLAVVACGAATVSTISRGATLALIGGSLVTVGVLIAQRFATPERTARKRSRWFMGAVPLGVLAGCLVVLVVYSNAGHVERQLSRTSLNEFQQARSKFAAWRSAATLVEESPWIGVGRGAFEASFTRVHEASGLATYSHLENEYLQAVVDWGVPGALALAMALVWLAYTGVRRWRDSSLVAGALGALAVVAMQSNVDFGLELLGIAAPVTAIAATLAYVPLRQLTRVRASRAVRVGHVLALGIGATLLFSAATSTLDEDRRRLSRGASIDVIRASIERHPFDYYGFAVAAEVLNRAGDPRSIRLLNHAMALHPTHPQLHEIAGRMLQAQGFGPQAAIEYAAAMRAQGDPRRLLKEIMTRFPGEQAATALPIDYPEPDVLVRILEELGRPDVARAWLMRVLTIHSKRARPCDLMYKLAERGDVAAAEVAGHYCGDWLPDFQSRLALARMLLAKESYAEVLRVLSDVETWQSRRDDKIDAWLVLCDAHRALGFGDEAKRCLRKLDASADMLDERRPELLKRIEEINAARPIAAPTVGSAAAP
jgi:O-antigen ligase